MMATTASPVTKTRALTFGFAALASAALTIGGIAPAYAADVQLGPTDIAGFENGDESQVGSGYNYDQWHIGSVYNSELGVSESLQFNECSVTTLAVPEASESNATVTQLLKGYPIDQRPSSIEEIEQLFASLSIDIAQGNVMLQVPMFWDYPLQPTSAGPGDTSNFASEPFAEGEGAVRGAPEVESGFSVMDAPLGERYFTTFRNVEPFATPGQHLITLDTMTTDSTDEIEQTLAELFDEMREAERDGVTFQVLGVGFTGSHGAEVNSITFDGETYAFGTGDCTPDAPVDPVTPIAPKKPVAVETDI